MAAIRNLDMQPPHFLTVLVAIVRAFMLIGQQAPEVGQLSFIAFDVARTSLFYALAGDRQVFQPHDHVGLHVVHLRVNVNSHKQLMK